MLSGFFIPIPTLSAIMTTPNATPSRQVQQQQHDENKLTIHSSKENLCQMELEVTNFFLTLLPLFIIVIPYLVFWVSMMAYFHMIPRGSDYVEQTNLVSYIAYVALLPSVHVVIFPLAYLFFNKEISFSCHIILCCCRSSNSDNTTHPATHDDDKN